MTFTVAAVIGGVATLAGAAMSSSAAGSAARTQAAAADRAANLQYEQYLKGVELQEPFRQGGLQGQNRLLTYLGLGGEGQYDDSSYNKALQKYNADLANLDPSKFFIGGGGGGSYTSGGGESDQQFYREPTGGTFDQAGFDAARAGLVAPNREQFRLSGGNANDPMFGKYATAEYTPEMFAKGMDPGYQFRLKEGMKGLESSAAARGNLLSGGTLKGIQRYGQDMASQEYQNAFNRYQAERAGTLNPLQSLAGVGQSSANTLGTMGMNYANQAGEAYQGAANARASGYIGQSNAFSNAIGNISNQYYQNQLMNRVFPQKTPHYTVTGSTAGGFVGE
jgi:type II secretory pathway pseudopilin PulG